MVAFIAAFLLRAIDSVVSCPILAAVLDKCQFCLPGPKDRGEEDDEAMDAAADNQARVLRAPRPQPSSLAVVRRSATI
ncbi:unnamed protein product, partial [Ectocarpus sp. 12 AP-2014]